MNINSETPVTKTDIAFWIFEKSLWVICFVIGICFTLLAAFLWDALKVAKN